MPSSDETSTLYVRNVPPLLVREAKVKAAREGTTLTNVVIDALRRSTQASEEDAAPSEEPSRGGSETGLHDSIAESMAWYETHRADLLEQYASQFVAIVDREVVDHDEDFESLATRVFERFGSSPIFMPRVGEGTEKVRVRSPRVARSR